MRPERAELTLINIVKMQSDAVKSANTDQLGVFKSWPACRINELSHKKASVVAWLTVLSDSER